MIKKIIFGLIMILGLGTVSYFVFFGKEDSVYMETVKAERQDLIQTVEETGRAEALKNIKLSFDRTGRLKENKVEVGDKVEAGEVLAELDHDTLLIQEREARAILGAAQIKERKLQAGGSPSDIQVLESQLRQAEESYQSALKNFEEVKKTTENNIKQAQRRLDDLKDEEEITPQERAVLSAQQNLADTKVIYEKPIEKNQDTALSTVNSSLSTIDVALNRIDNIINDRKLKNLGVLSAKDRTKLRETEKYHEKSEKLWEEARKVYLQAKEEKDQENMDSLLEKTIGLLNHASLALDYCYQALKNSITSFEFPASQLEALKTDINQQTSNINSAISSTQGIAHSLRISYSEYNTRVNAAENTLEEAKTTLNDSIKKAEDSLESSQMGGEQEVTAAQNQVDNAKRSLEVAESQLERARSAGRQEDLDLIKTEIKQAQLSLESIQKRIEDSFITAPISGEINRVNFEPGEQVSPQTPVIEMGDNENLKIKVHISETDIDKINRNDEVTITFDAFSREDEFYGLVEFIDPSETRIQDIVYYETTINLIELDDEFRRIKPGMTADVIIHTDERKDVLAVPSRAIIERTDGQRIVRVPKNSYEIEEREVRTGLRGDGGLTEIVEGLEEGEQVITYIEN